MINYVHHFKFRIFNLAWYLLWKFVLSRFGVIRALLQIANNDQPPAQPRQQPRRQHIRRE